MTGCQYSMSALKRPFKVFLTCCIIFFTMLFMEFVSIRTAYAQAADPQVIDCRYKLDENGDPTDEEREGFTQKIVGCIEDILLKNVGEEQFQKIRDDIKNVVVSLFVIYIAFFGIQTALGGVRRPMSETMTHLFKVTAVAFFSISVGLDIVFPMFKDAQQAMVEMVSDLALMEGTECASGGDNTIWARVDCLMASVLAYDLYLPDGADLSTESFLPDVRQATSLGAMGVGMFASSIGVLVLVLTVITMVVVLVAFASAVVYYVMCLVAIIVLAIVAPIIIPTILFQTTKGFFDTWFQALIAYTVQPAILFGYLAFMTHAMAIIIYGSGNPDGTFGLHNVLERAKEVIEDPTKRTEKVLFQEKMELLHEAGIPEGDIEGHSEDQLGAAVTARTIEIGEDDEAALLVNLIAVTLIAAILVSFMHNVMSFGAQLAGIPYTFSMGGYNNIFSGAMLAGKNLIK